jgi:putative transposase
MIRAQRAPDKIRLNPTPEQAQYFRKAVGVSRFVYNWGLAEWKRQYEAGLKPSAVELKKQFNAIKREQFPFVMDVLRDASVDPFVKLGKAFKNFFDSVTGKRSDQIGYPRFKSKKRSKQTFGMANDKFYVRDQGLYVPRLGMVNMAERLRFSGKLMAGVISCVAGKWYVSITVEVERPEPVQFKAESVGIDLGLKTLATLSNGVEFENQRLLRSELKRLRSLSRGLSRKQQGSGRWWKQKQKIATFHQRIANRRSDVIHKMTTEISQGYRMVGIEDLHVKGMIRNHKLALSIADAAMGEVTRQLTYKKQCFGGVLQKVGRYYASSKTCNDCGYVNQELKLSDRSWVCAGCGTVKPRDWNASKNIEQEALRLIGV